MCGRFRDLRGWTDYRTALEAVSMPVQTAAAPNLEPRQQVRPTDPATIFRKHEGGVTVARVRWWLVPWFHHGALTDWRLTTFDARSETVQTARSYRDSFARRRCLIAADGWYEWIGPKGSEQMWLFEPADDAPIMLAGIWDRCATSDVGIVESCAIVTQPTSSPLNGYHDRAPVVLWPDEWARWLDTDADVDDLLGPESRDRYRVMLGSSGGSGHGRFD